jgi:hypothetical protein
MLKEEIKSNEERKNGDSHCSFTIEAGKTSFTKYKKRNEDMVIDDQMNPCFLLVENAATGQSVSINTNGLWTPPVYHEYTIIINAVIIISV